MTRYYVSTLESSGVRLIHAVSGAFTKTLGGDMVWAFTPCKPNAFRLCLESPGPVTCLACIKEGG